MVVPAMLKTIPLRGWKVLTGYLFSCLLSSQGPAFSSVSLAQERERRGHSPCPFPDRLPMNWPRVHSSCIRGQNAWATQVLNL